MATTIKINLEFISAVGATTSFSDFISHERDTSEDGKSNLASEVFAELRKCVSYADHLAQLPSIRDLLKTESSFTYDATDVGDVVNLFNVPAVWLELVNTFTNLRYVLAQARSYKDLEPPQTSPENNASCAYLHFQKMYSLNLAALDLAKIQDLVIRLLYESFSGKLIKVDLDDSEWEKKLTLKEAKKGLKEKLDNKEINCSDFDSIMTALSIPSKSAYKDAVLRYRNGVAHRIRPSVDYPRMFTDISDRKLTVQRDSTGKEISRFLSFGGARTTPEFVFDDLYMAFVDYMKHLAKMLEALRAIPRLC